MKIAFENLGVIKKAEIDLSKKLTVLCGPNGTGKTYLCYALYGFTYYTWIGSNIFSFTDLIEKKNITIELDTKILYDYYKRYSRPLSTNFNDIFGTSDKESSYKVLILENLDQFTERIKQSQFTFEYDDSSQLRITYTKKSNSNQLRIEAKMSSQRIITPSRWRESNLNARLMKYLCFNSIVNSVILPVERNSVYTFISDLTVNSFDKNSFSINEEKIKDTYPLAIKELMKTAADLNRIKLIKGKYAYLADSIEAEILHGNISVSENGELLFAPKGTVGIALSVHLTASIIKNLSGLLIYLRHQAKKGDLLIIDEPEIGLHPDNQVLLARIFARLINNGLRLVISTHSDHIIRELNNLIMLSSDKPEIKAIKEKYGYKDDEQIKCDDINAYLFDFGKDGNAIVHPVSIEENGFEISSIDAEINKLNKISDDLYDTLNYE